MRWLVQIRYVPTRKMQTDLFEFKVFSDEERAHYFAQQVLRECEGRVLSVVVCAPSSLKRASVKYRGSLRKAEK